jgi:hypothetical protein
VPTDDNCRLRMHLISSARQPSHADGAMVAGKLLWLGAFVRGG